MACSNGFHTYIEFDLVSRSGSSLPVKVCRDCHKLVVDDDTFRERYAGRPGRVEQGAPPVQPPQSHTYPSGVYGGSIYNGGR